MYKRGLVIMFKATFFLLFLLLVGSGGYMFFSPKKQISFSPKKKSFACDHVATSSMVH